MNEHEMADEGTEVPLAGSDPTPVPIPVTPPIPVGSAHQPPPTTARPKGRAAAQQAASTGWDMSAQGTNDRQAASQITPSYGMKLFRIDRARGLRSEIGTWFQRPRQDAFEHSWIRDTYGGGDYVLAMHPVGRWDLISWETPVSFEGQPKHQPAQQYGGYGYPQYEQQPDPFAAAALANPATMQNPWLMMMLMQRMQPTPPPPPPPVVQGPSPEILELRAANQRLEAMIQQRDSDERHRTELQSLRDSFQAELRSFKESLPKGESGFDKLLAQVPGILSLIQSYMAQGQQRESAVQAAMQQSQNQLLAIFQSMGQQERQHTKEFLQFMMQQNDPTKQVNALQASSGLLMNVFAMLGRVMETQASSGPPWYAELLGSVGKAAEQMLPMIPMMVAAKKGDPGVQATLEKMLAEDGDELGGQVPPALSTASPPGPTLPSNPPAPAKPGVQGPAPAASASERVLPVLKVRKLAAWVRERLDPEQLIIRLDDFLGDCYRWDLHPKAWEQEPWWRDMPHDPIRGLSELFERTGESVTWPPDYVEDVRREAERWVERIKERAEAAGIAVPEDEAPPAAAEPQAAPTSGQTKSGSDEEPGIPEVGIESPVDPFSAAPPQGEPVDPEPEPTPDPATEPEPTTKKRRTKGGKSRAN